MPLTAKTQSRLSNRFHLFVCAAALLSAFGAYGQNVNGSIVGTVSDSTSAAIPAATVTITDENTNVSRTAQTDASGYYSVPDLPPGTYKVTVQKDGFSTAVNSGIGLFADRTARADMTLQSGFGYPDSKCKQQRHARAPDRHCGHRPRYRNYRCRGTTTFHRPQFSKPAEYPSWRRRGHQGPLDLLQSAAQYGERR